VEALFLVPYVEIWNEEGVQDELVEEQVQSALDKEVEEVEEEEVFEERQAEEEVVFEKVQKGEVVFEKVQEGEVVFEVQVETETGRAKVA